MCHSGFWVRIESRVRGRNSYNKQHSFDNLDVTNELIGIAMTLFAKLYSEEIVPVAQLYTNPGRGVGLIRRLLN